MQVVSNGWTIKDPSASPLFKQAICSLLSTVPVYRGGFPRVVVVAKEVDGLVILPGNGIQISSVPSCA